MMSEVEMFILGIGTGILIITVIEIVQYHFLRKQYNPPEPKPPFLSIKNLDDGPITVHFEKGVTAHGPFKSAFEAHAYMATHPNIFPSPPERKVVKRKSPRGGKK